MDQETGVGVCESGCVDFGTHPPEENWSRGNVDDEGDGPSGTRTRNGGPFGVGRVSRVTLTGVTPGGTG